MSEDIQQQIQIIFQDLESRIRQEIVKWWNNAKGQRPESLPWFTHGIKGLAHKLYHGNAAENPEWKNYKAESHRMSLSEYAFIKTNLETILEAAGPTEAVNELIRRLMPMIQASFEAVSKLIPISHSEPEEEPGMGHDEDLPDEDDEETKTAKEAEAAEARDKAEREEQIRKATEEEQARKNAEIEQARKNAEIEQARKNAEIEQARKAAEAEREERARKGTGDSNASDSNASDSNASDSNASDSEESPSTGVIHSLQSYATSDKGTVSTLKTIDDLKNVGIISAKIQGGKKKGIQIASNSSAGAEGADDVPRALQDLIKELAGLPESTKDQLGLSSHQTDAFKDPDDTRDFYALPAFYEALTKKSDLFMGITVSKDFFKEMKAFLNKERFTDVSKVENTISEFKKMLSENNEENLNIVMSRRMDIKSKSKFLISKIKQR